MRLDPKYFNLFMVICAILTLLVIVYGTVNYSNNQILEFENQIEEVRFDTLSFESYSDGEILSIQSQIGRPVLIHFWSTWSGKSIGMNEQLHHYQMQNPSLQVIAAVVKDGEEQVMNYIRENSFEFIYVNGTDFFQNLQVPGVPSQILIDENGTLFSVQVGNDMENLLSELDRMVKNE